MHKKLRKSVNRYFLTGFLVLVPLGATFSLLLYLIRSMDGLFEIQRGRFLFFVPEIYHPDRIFGFHLPGLGLLVTALLIVLVGAVATNVIGRRFQHWLEWLIDKIPFIRSVYSAIKMFMEAIFVGKKDSFRRVVLVEMFARGTYGLGFVTGEAPAELQARSKKKVLNVFVATTPNPTSGFYIMVPEDATLPLSMSIEDAFKVIMSGGILMPQMPPEVARQAEGGTLPTIP